MTIYLNISGLPDVRRVPVGSLHRHDPSEPRPRQGWGSYWIL